MTFPAIIDTNVLVAGVLTKSVDAPTARIVDGMLAGRFPFLVSVDLMQEYREVLLRPKIVRRHHWVPEDVDAFLTRVALHGILRDPSKKRKHRAPDPGDDHLWALMEAVRGVILVTGDELLITSAPPSWSILSPRSFVRIAGG